MGFLYTFRFLHQPCGPILTPRYPTQRKFLVPQVFEYSHVPTPMPKCLPNPPITVTAVAMPTVSRRPPVHGPLWYPNEEMQYPPSVWSLHQSYPQRCRKRRPIKIEKPPDLQEFSSCTGSQNHLQQPTEGTESFTNENILHEYKFITTHAQQVKSSAHHLDKMEEVQNYKREQNKREQSKLSNIKPQPNTQQKNKNDYCTNNNTNSTATNGLRNTKTCEADKSKYSNKHSGRTQEKKTKTIKSVTELNDSYECKTVRKEKTKTYKEQHDHVNGKEFDKRTSVKTYIKNDSKDYYKTTTKESTSYSRKHSTSTIKTKVLHIKEVLKNNELNHKERGNVESVSLTIEHYPSSYTKERVFKRHKKERSKQQTTGQSKNLQEVSKGAQNFSKVSV